jgi:hypothetical protein
LASVAPENDGCSHHDRKPGSGDLANPSVSFRHLHPFFAEDFTMLYTVAVVLIILWLLGLVTSYTLGGFIHILLVIALVSILLRVISGRG